MLLCFLHLANFGPTEGIGVAAAAGGIITALVMLRKMGPEKEALYISSAQGAATIMDSLVTTLRAEVDRCRARVVVLESENDRLQAENERLEAENEGLRRKRGERRGDRKPNSS